MSSRHQAEFSMGRLLLNCDLGEHEPEKLTRALMRCVDAANICCGVHAGSLEKTRGTLQLAKEYGVKVGAHPGMAVAGGRGGQWPSPESFADLLCRQLGTFFEAAESVGAPVHHVKLHGSLYSAVELDSALAKVYLRQLQLLKGVKVFTLSGGSFAECATAAGIEVVPELFADRGYRANGMLVPRSEPGALLHSVDSAVDRVRVWQETGAMPVAGGQTCSLSGGTLCVHSDSPQALELLHALRQWNSGQDRPEGRQ